MDQELERARRLLEQSEHSRESLVQQVCLHLCVLYLIAYADLQWTSGDERIKSAASSKKTSMSFFFFSPTVRQSDVFLSVSALHDWRSPGGGHARWAAEDEEGDEWASEGPAGDFSAHCSATWQPHWQGGGKRWTARARYWIKVWVNRRGEDGEDLDAVYGWMDGLKRLPCQLCNHRNSWYFVLLFLCIIFSLKKIFRQYTCIADFWIKMPLKGGECMAVEERGPASGVESLGEDRELIGL